MSSSNFQWQSRGQRANDPLVSALARYKAVKTADGGTSARVLTSPPMQQTQSLDLSNGPKASWPQAKPLKSCLKASSTLKSPAFPSSMDSDDSEHNAAGGDFFDVANLRKGGKPSRAVSTPAFDAEGQARRRQNRRNRRKRCSDPAIRVQSPPARGILKKQSSYTSLRFMSEPPAPKLQGGRKCVSFTGLSPCRWESNGSNSNIKALVAQKRASEATASSQGNFVWGSQASSSGKAARSLSTSSLSRLSQELNMKKSGRYNQTCPSKPRRHVSEGSKQRGDTNMFQASIFDFQTSLAQSAQSINTPPSMPRRQGSFENEQELSPMATLRQRLQLPDNSNEARSVPLARRAPAMPSRRVSMEHDTSTSPVRTTPKDSFHQSQAPAMPSRRVSMEHDTSISPVRTTPKDSFHQSMGTDCSSYVATKSLIYQPPRIPSRRESMEHDGEAPEQNQISSPGA